MNRQDNRSVGLRDRLRRRLKPVITTRPLLRVWILLACLVLAGTESFAKNPQAKLAEEEMEFGFKAARRGYWQEALERFQLADELTPNQARILNNIAVALEANGRFDEARTTYRAALALDPGDGRVRRNFERFEEFYAAHLAVGDDDKQSDDGGAEGPAVADGAGE